MTLAADLPIQPRLDRRPSELLPSLSDLGIWDAADMARQPASPPTFRLPQYDPAAKCSLRDFQEQPVNISSPRTIVRLPSFSELRSKIPFDEQQRDSSSLRRQSSCETVPSLVPSLSASVSNASSPACSPRTPLDGHFTFRPNQWSSPLPPYSSKFQLETPSEYLLAQAKGFDTRNWRRPSWPQSTTLRHHVRTSPRPSDPPSPRGYSSDDAFQRERAGICKKPARTPHINKEYTLEQNLWIIYNHVDLKKGWNDVKRDFKLYFTEDTVDRTDGGLQSTYYRWNEECPIIDEDGLLQYGEGDGYNRWDVKTYKAKVRAAGKKTLIDRYATEILAFAFPWILPHDMAKARILAERRRPYREAYEVQKALRGRSHL